MRSTRRAKGNLTRCPCGRPPLAFRDENVRSVDGSVVPTADVGVEDRFAAIVQGFAGNETRCHG